MDDGRFDALAKVLVRPGSRRAALGLLVGGGAAAVADGAAARHKRKKCKPPLTRCGKACVDTRQDSANCGACGIVCQAGETCNAGTCACSGAHSRCGGRCVDLVTDSANCGACDVVCQATEVCDAGSCRCAPQCDGFQCGDDGCGGSCGSCGTFVCYQKRCCARQAHPFCSTEPTSDGCGGVYPANCNGFCCATSGQLRCQADPCS